MIEWIKAREREIKMVKIRRFVCGNLMANGYVISTSDGRCFIIDPGYQPGNYVKAIKESGLVPEGIILTHHHHDHSGAADQLRSELGCPLMMHRSDTDHYTGSVDVFFDGGEVLPFGEDPIRVIHTPGHTRGGICLMIENSRICFTGDTIFNVDLGRTDLEDGSPDEMERSIRDIIDGWSNDIRIYPGHGDDCTMKTVRRINREFLDIVEQR